jgi:transcriptional regulator with XRE-family HTH domain
MPRSTGGVPPIGAGERLSPARKSDHRDKAIGQRVRQFRVGAGLSQERLSELLGVTFQQVQKYETGANRIAATRLLDIAAVLGVPIIQFYQGLIAPGSDAAGREGIPEAADMLLHFSAITRPGWRSIALRAVREIAAIEVEIDSAR